MKLTDLEKRKLLRKLKKGDVLSMISDIQEKNFFKKIGLKIAMITIQLTQRFVFGKKYEWKDTHIVIYFSKNKIFSVAPPKGKFVTLDHLLKGVKRLTVYRYNDSEFDIKDINILEKESTKFIKGNYDYDIGQLVDILINTFLGYPFVRKTAFFDKGRNQKVCSVSVAAMFARWRDIALKKNPKRKIPRLFSIMNKKNWPKNYVKEFKKNGNKWNIEETFPANFANTKELFNNEFKKVYEIEKKRN